MVTKKTVFYFLFFCLVLAIALSSLVETTSASTEENAEQIIPHCAVMYGNGVGIRVLEKMEYYPETCLNRTIGTETPVSLYEAGSLGTGETTHIIMTFKDKVAAQKFVATPEGLNAAGEACDAYCVARGLDNLNKIKTGMNSYAGTKGRPGIGGMQLKNEKGFAISFKVKRLA
ncbi:MAG: hypothetical protein WCQ96_00770 [Patescibacteria group bacterium]